MGTVLLDLDGTLVDSAPLIVEHLARAFVTAGVAVPPPGRLRTMVGPPFEEAVPALGVSGAQARELIAAYRRTYAPVAPTSPPFPHTRALLEGVRAAGHTLAVATSKREDMAAAVAARHGFDVALVGGSDAAGGRVGKAAVIGSVLERLGVVPGRDAVTMVGDRVHDVEGAAAHGIPTIGVTWGYAEPGELAGAAAVARDVDELLVALHADGVWSVPPTAA